MSKRPNCRKRPFILIEVLVATSLFVLLLIAIFGIFWRTAKVNESITTLRRANEQMLLAQARLDIIFSKVEHTPPRPYFFTEKNTRSSMPSLVFTIDSGAQQTPRFCKKKIAKLYVEDEKLCLATFPNWKKTIGIPDEIQKETLLNNVKDLSFEFFLAPEKEVEEQEDIAKRAPTRVWAPYWEKEYAQAPTLVKLTVTLEKSGKHTLWFFIPIMIAPVLYER